QMTLDDDLVDNVDRVVREQHTSRSAFTRDALREALKKHEARRLEQRHRRGYAEKPVAVGEFSAWGDEQAWGDS
ncbi:MAG: ribbon-helix-helix protein, CopG family, partial [Candidatus Zixiibacteriota bacterium]